MRGTIARALAAATLLLSLALSLSAQEIGTDEKRRQTLRFGIESEVLELLDTLAAEKEGRYDDLVLAILEKTRSSKLKAGVIDYFKKTANPAAAEYAKAIIEQRDLYDEALVSSALSYLSELRSPEGLAAARDIIRLDERKYLSAAIRLLGRAGGDEDVDCLLALLDSYPPENVEQEAVVALGEIKSPKAAERLTAIIKATDKPKFTRAYACKALALSGAADAVETIVWASVSDDPLVRTYAVEALAELSGAVADAAILEALRDPYVKVRIAAAKACGKKRIADAMPALQYKCRNDPEAAVKEESFRAIAEYGGEGIAFAQAFFKDEKNALASRVLCWALVAKKDPVGSGVFLESTLLQAAVAKDQALYKKLSYELFQLSDRNLSYLVKRYLADKDAPTRMAALEWARRAKARELIPEITALSTGDPVESVRKRALDVLDYLSK